MSEMNVNCIQWVGGLVHVGRGLAHLPALQDGQVHLPARQAEPPPYSMLHQSTSVKYKCDRIIPNWLGYKLIGIGGGGDKSAKFIV